MTGQHDEDAAWRAIVENYGERPRVDPPDAGPDPAAALEDSREPEVEDPWQAGGRPSQEDGGGVEDPDDRFVPPDPPPLPHPPPARFAAWLGVFGAPAVVFLVAMVPALALPSWLGYLLLASFLGGFGYLVLHMHQGPRDPGDDGARL